ncbi:hypothetical protein [Brevundimonas lenta]|uniref:Peptidoglycan/LPS O-acetylase OafA/YrhL n=1 Tax=Brevundimonas lenta TaxID=424796 RepID=A0A7W6JE83_9CAUL|nr:hypothetical protein [Brevundimonas lenta]MBB4083481.1 peptidoglycan/LPS O-acetylase OafA/YrhL [Brevundimonas lenta]
MISGWRTNRQIGPEPLLVKIRPAIIYASCCVGATGLLIAFYWLVRSDRANIYVGCGFFGCVMVLGMVQLLQTRRFLNAGALLVLAVILIAAALWTHEMMSPTVRIVPV